MSDSRQRLDTPRTSRRPSLNLDSDTVGRFSESIARFLGTGRYLMWQTVLVVVWITLNLFAVGLRWDPYPFILLNLAFSTQAAYAAPLILLAQNRQENRDKVALDEDRRRAQQTNGSAVIPYCTRPQHGSPCQRTPAGNSLARARDKSSPTSLSGKSQSRPCRVICKQRDSACTGTSSTRA